jgi:hypothetical protein
MDSGRLQPILLGGLFIGVLSALPVINAGNCCCCLWIVAGGVLAVYLRQQNLARQVDAAEGALVGLLAGLVGGILAAILSIPVQMLLGPIQQEWMSRILAGNPDIPPEMRGMMEQMAGGAAMQAANAVLSIIFSVAFGMIGGLLGVAIFKRNAPPQQPPPPQPPTVIPHDPGVAQ